MSKTYYILVVGQYGPTITPSISSESDMFAAAREISNAGAFATLYPVTVENASIAIGKAFTKAELALIVCPHCKGPLALVRLNEWNCDKCHINITIRTDEE
jgi:ribosomal protein L37AE/L43A